MSRTVRALLDQVATTLCDPEGVHWTEEELLGYFNEALCEIAGLRPDAFVKRVSLKLKPGAQQKLPSCYVDLVKVNGNLDQSGVVTDQEATKTVSTAGDRLGAKFKCANEVAETFDGISGYKVTAASHGYFTVDPPVPEGTKAYLDAMVYVAPPSFELEDLDDPKCVLPCIYDAQIVDWILKRAYEKDTESQWAVSRASYHFQAFRIGMNADYRAASRLRSGYILGQTGDGNEQVGIYNDRRGVFDG
ncbi:MAG: DUF6682 family protein [Jhaorihella sp.]